jgi:DNA-binding XRE family transcriptional regulator
MKRRAIADWSAGVVTVAVLVLGGLVVVKPALDHWNDVYRENPFRASVTTQTVRLKAGEQTQRTITTRKDATSGVEQALGKGGLLFLRLALLAIAAFLLAALTQRVVLGRYGLRDRPREAQATGAGTPGHPGFAASPPPDRTADANQVTAGNGSQANGQATAQEANGSELASSIGKFVAWRREDLGLSQRELAKRAGISHTVISRLESGQQVPSPKTLERLAEAFRN